MTEPPSVRFILYGDIAEGSPNKRPHWRTRHAIDQKWKLLAYHAWCELPRPIFFPGKVRVSFHAYRARALDECQLHGSRCCKSIIDGLKGRLFTDDTPRYVEWGLVQQTPSRIHVEDPYVEVLVEPLANKAP